MSMVTTMQVPQILPISDLRTNLNVVCDIAEETGQPIFMTKNGKAKLVVYDSEAYEEMIQGQRFAQKLREAEIEARYVDATFSMDELNADMQRVFEHWNV